jgi:hypothetical protein
MNDLADASPLQRLKYSFYHERFLGHESYAMIHKREQTVL